MDYHCVDNIKIFTIDYEGAEEDLQVKPKATEQTAL